MSPLPVYRRTLTGACRPRRGLFGRVVMQVQVKVESLDPWPRCPPMPPIAGEKKGAFAERLREYRDEPYERPVLAAWHEWRDAKASDFVLAAESAPALVMAGGR